MELTPEGRADSVFRSQPRQFKAQQWHSVQVAQPPDDAVVLASSPLCRVQAMRIGTKAYLMQYHVELELGTIPNWGCVLAYEKALEATRGKGALVAFTAEADPLMPDFINNARALFRAFMNVARAGLSYTACPVFLQSAWYISMSLSVRAVS